MSGPIVYEFPTEFPFRLQLVRRSPPGGVTGAGAPYQLVRRGLYAAEIGLAELTRQDLERLSDAVTEELARS